MASIKNSQQSNPYVYSNMDSLKFVQQNYFTTGANNANSIAQKLEIINLICFLTQQMAKAFPGKYSSCLEVLEAIFNCQLSIPEVLGVNNHIRAFGMLCDDLMYGTNDAIPKPEGYSNGNEIKDKIYNYFTEEWTPF